MNSTRFIVCCALSFLFLVPPALAQAVAVARVEMHAFASATLAGSAIRSI